MAEPVKILVGAGIDTKGDAAITLETGFGVVVLDIYAAMAFTDLVEKKIGEAINWHKLAYDTETPELFRTACAGTA